MPRCPPFLRFNTKLVWSHMCFISVFTQSQITSVHRISGSEGSAEISLKSFDTKVMGSNV